MYRLNLAFVLLISILSGCSTEPPPQDQAYAITPLGEIVDSGEMPIEPTGALVTSETELNIGDAVQVMWEGDMTLEDGTVTNESWWKGEVLELEEDGTVKIHYTGWHTAFDEIVTRDKLRIDK
ncbi:MAG: hypothetical protein ACKVH8_07075 [Pirellulales bacterium]|jgi:hypothetical protein